MRERILKHVPFVVACCAVLIALICFAPAANAATTAITLTSSSQDVLIGNTLQITASSTVTSWTSSDTNIATVNSSGLVTGHMAGEVTITAAGGAGSATIKIYVRMADGYYRIYNNYSTYYLGVDDFSIKSGTNVINRSRYTQSPYCYSQIWKITYAGNGNYTIRAMHYDDLWLYKDNSKACVYDIDGTDGSSTLSNFAQWKIQAYGGSYVIRSKFNAYEALCSNSSSFDSPVTVEICVGSPSSSSFRWYFYSATVPTGVIVYEKYSGLQVDSLSSVAMNAGDRLTLEEIGILPYVHCENGIAYTDYITSGNVLIADQFVDSSGVEKLQAYQLGTTTISYHLTFDFDDYTYTYSFALSVEPMVNLVGYIEKKNGILIQDMTNYFEEASDYLTPIYTSVEETSFETIEVDPFIWHFRTPQILFVMTHGTAETLERGPSLNLTMDDLEGVDLSNLEFVVLAACSVAEGGYNPSNVTNKTPANLLEQFICCGADTAVGFSVVTPREQADNFLHSLFLRIIDKDETLQEAIDYLFEQGGYDIYENQQIYIGGDGSFTFGN